MRIDAVRADAGKERDRVELASWSALSNSKLPSLPYVQFHRRPATSDVHTKGRGSSNKDEIEREVVWIILANCIQGGEKIENLKILQISFMNGPSSGSLLDLIVWKIMICRQRRSENDGWRRR